jgi:predicted dehydrogenase
VVRDSVVRIAIVGAGIMGGYHARVARSLPNVEMAFVVDRDEEKGRKLASYVGAAYAGSVDALRGQVDAAIVSVPTDAHVEVGTTLIDFGIDVLIEKPIASTVEEAKDLVAAAASSERILMVGHVERFNPAVIELARQVDGLIHIDVRRLGPFSPRVPIGVTLDLMIHDIDLVCSLAGGPPERISSVARQVRSQNEDLVSSILIFPDGVSAVLTASRVSQAKQRQIELTQRDNVVIADLVRQQVTVHRVAHSEYVDERGSMYRQSGVIEIPYLEHQGEPLALEQRHFIECVLSRAKPVVSGEDGLAALDTALRIRDQAVCLA